MTSFFKRLFGGKQQSIRRGHQLARRTSLHVEELETRTLMSVTSVLATAVVPVKTNLNLAVNTFSDGNFAAPAQSANSYTYNPSGSPWTFNGSSPNGSGVTTNGSGFTGGNPSAPTSQVAFLQEFGHFSQSFTLSAGTYSISFLAAQRGNAQGSFQAFEVWVDNTLVDLVVPQSTAYTSYQTVNFTVAGTSTHTIQFKGVDPLQGNNTAFITNVKINPAATKADPNEPAVLAQTVADFQKGGSINYDDMLGLFTTMEGQIAPVISIPNGAPTPISPVNSGTSKPTTVMSPSGPSATTTSETQEAGYCTGGLTAFQLECLQTIVGDAASLDMAPDIAYLANCVVNGNPVNVTANVPDNQYSVGVGNLFAVSSSSTYGSMASQLQDLVNVWFWGEDLPTLVSTTAVPGNYYYTPVTYTYSPGSGLVVHPYPLFNPATNVPSYTDVEQTGINDCYLMASLAETAVQTPAVIQSMFTQLGSSGNIWMVRFYVGATPTYVTVDSQLPSDGDVPANGALWAALAEKAYAILFAGNNYNNLNQGGLSQGPLAQITGQSIWETNFYHINGVGVTESSASSFSAAALLGSNYATTEDHLAGQIYQAFAAYQLVTLGSSGNGNDGAIDGNHEYFVIAAQYTDGTYSFTLGNPWGYNSPTQHPATVNVSEDQLFNNFDYVAFTLPQVVAGGPGEINPNQGTPAITPPLYGASESAPPLQSVAACQAEAGTQSQILLLHGDDQPSLHTVLGRWSDYHTTNTDKELTLAYRDAVFAQDYRFGRSDPGFGSTVAG